VKLTREIAYSPGMDAANRSMRSAGRKAWNEDHASIAAKEFNRLWPLCPQHCEPGECWKCEPAPAPSK
jgi:hypothetical protein